MTDHRPLHCFLQSSIRRVLETFELMANAHFGFKEILLKRMSWIILWHICIQSFILQFVASVNVSEDPLLWMITWLKNLFKPRFIIIFLFQLFLSAVCIVTESTQYLRVKQCDNITRFRFICSKVSLYHFIWLLVYFLQGILSAIVFLFALKHYFVDPLNNEIQPEDKITETIIILLSNAIGMNLIFFINDFFRHQSFKYFSFIQQNHCISMPAIFVVARNAAVKSLYCSVVFVVFYLLGGHSICSFICTSFSVRCNISYSIVFNPFVFYCLWLLNAFIFFNNLILKSLFNIYLTTKIDFPIVSSTSTKQHDVFTLKDAISTDNIPLIQYMGYYDLNVISQFDASRRKQIFSLSYPGGHPYTWREISQEALKLITDTINQLEKITNANKSNTATDNAKPTIEKYYSKMRPLSITHYIDEKNSNANKKLKDNIFSKITNSLKSIRVVAYFAEEMTEKQMESALQHYQALGLACYSLSNLAAASKLDDKYGVVQQDLSIIIISLLQLNVALNKMTVVINKKTNSSILRIKKYLASVVKSSLYKLSINFGLYSRDLNLSSDDEKLFSSFVSFKN